MTTIPLEFRNGHLFIDLSGRRWLLDTGAPESFGEGGGIEVAGKNLDLTTNHLGFDAKALSSCVGVACAGLIGADILGHFDHIIDVSGGKLTMSRGHLSHDGILVPLSQFMGIPILTVKLDAIEFRMFFDTGAQISYLQDDATSRYPHAGYVSDFFPGYGQFQTETREIPFQISNQSFLIRCGRLPTLLGMTLSMAKVQGILGNAILTDRVVGYFPRRNMLTI